MAAMIGVVPSICKIFTCFLFYYLKTIFFLIYLIHSPSSTGVFYNLSSKTTLILISCTEVMKASSVKDYLYLIYFKTLPSLPRTMYQYCFNKPL